MVTRGVSGEVHGGVVRQCMPRKVSLLHRKVIIFKPIVAVINVQLRPHWQLGLSQEAGLVGVAEEAQGHQGCRRLVLWGTSSCPSSVVSSGGCPMAAAAQPLPAAWGMVAAALAPALAVRKLPSRSWEASGLPVTVGFQHCHQAMSLQSGCKLCTRYQEQGSGDTQHGLSINF